MANTPLSRTTLLAAVGALAALLALACGGEMAPLSIPPHAPGTPTPEPAREPVIFTGTPERLTWTDCGDGFECGTLGVPLDYSDPTGRYIKLALIRLPSTSPVPPYGSLVINPGGPGGSGIGFLRQVGDQFSGEIRRGFDLVSFDPRGVGESAHFTCGKTPDAWLTLDVTPDDDADWQKYFEMVKDFTKRCQAASGDLMPHLGSRNVGRDPDRVREALGETKLTCLGVSCGTVIVAVYGNLFPMGAGDGP